ncbi:hypothetical protein T552_01638 [Pneumocystis carinii B80]|uniref:Transcriptional activator HAP2 n=1 Tax=Pneumocystis carinii (strain B80) TaxID=1408658 RepID=A0A0W4ZJ43_PNEC8|nr:hypothetical protein T552_01638 [Pneumocystis carinii B80]KTW28377.1 hypothetical protein T552_01638 [Pneumocystis carinii B80]
MAIKHSEQDSEGEIIHGNYWNNEMKFYNNQACFSMRNEKELYNKGSKDLYQGHPNTTLLKDVLITSFIEKKEELYLREKMNDLKSSYSYQGEGESIRINMKQYHRILKRRAARARIQENLGKREHIKPYLHESRHKHAMKRPRGPGGQFIKNKPSSEEEIMNMNEVTDK